MRQEDVAAWPGNDCPSDISARPRAFTTGNHKNAQMFRPFPARKTRVRLEHNSDDANVFSLTVDQKYSTHYILSSGYQRAGFRFRYSL
ncbi:uncharacterized protein N7473_001624 [Penicillium subrubescens]|uniref:uncharacterized protein n=1 Tax=Penicillium subrubescens TaxID=1316194 RepID=UPI0025459D43|nr:uncharacterized protein N7473_001624 [Penicillium subrubescens]KAJ5904708.1 hypothetical protein N7473_001624 [Penicillium subrubescens]